MFGWLDKIAAFIYRRGAALVESENTAAAERRATLRQFREDIAGAMVEATHDREGGSYESRIAAIGAATLATARAGEIDDDDARILVEHWRITFDAIPKGWHKEGGYPEDRWVVLGGSAKAATDRIGALISGAPNRLER